MDASLPIIDLGYKLYKTIVGFTHSLEKRWRYGLGVSIETTLLDCLEQLIMAKNAPKPMKASYLIQASGKLEILKLKLRLLLDLKLINSTRIFQVQAPVSEMGRMLGGWLKSTHGQ
jgi:hypothetical protein